MSLTVPARFRFAPEHGLWLGEVPSRFGTLELVVNSDSSAPAAQDLAALEAFMIHAGESIERLRRTLPLAFMWRPIRLAPTEQGKVGVQFRQALLGRMAMLFDDHAA